MILLKGVTKQYSDAIEPALKGIDLEVNENEVFGLLGPNGAGKTTIISILCGMIAQSSGVAQIQGKDIRENLHWLKQLIGVVPQDIALYPTLSAKENLYYIGSMYGLEKQELKVKINHWLEVFDLSDHANKRVERFSGGMKRKVNLIAGILHQPKLLFLDEPTVGVDVQSRNAIIDQLKVLNNEGMTMVYTSHHLQEAEHFCTKIAIIDGGRILTHGTPNELITSSESRDLEDVFLKLTRYVS